MLPKFSVVGESAICAGRAVTVTVADADFVVSATLVAFTVKDPALPGAVKSPELDTVPPVAVQVTAVLLVPVTVAVNCCVAPVRIEVEVGLMETETEGAAVTVMVAEADFVLSAALVAVMVKVPAEAGAV